VCSSDLPQQQQQRFSGTKKEYAIVNETLNGSTNSNENSSIISDIDTDIGSNRASGVGDDETSEQLLHEIFVPVEILRLVTFIENQSLQHRFMPGRMIVHFYFEIGESTDVPGKGRQKQEIEVELLNEEGVSVEEFFRRPVKPRLLCAYSTAHDARQMPVETIFSLKSKEVVQPTSSGNGSGNAYTSGGVLLHRHTLDEREALPVFGNALVFEEPLTRTQFSSIEAINFSSVDFYLRIAKRVEQADAPHIARLFYINNYQRLMRKQRIPCMRHAISDQCFFLVPLTYAYQSLLVRVHIFLSVRHHSNDQSHLSSAAGIDSTVYNLPTTPEFVIFDCDSLSNVIQFIDSQLINAHPLFNLSDIQGSLRPFVAPTFAANALSPATSKSSHVTNGFQKMHTMAAAAAAPSSWFSVWNDREKFYQRLLGKGKRALAESIRAHLRARISCLFYYIDVPPELQSDKPEPEPRRPTRRPPPLLQSIGTNTTDDEGGDAGELPDNSSSTLFDKDEHDAITQSQPVARVTRQLHEETRAHHSEERERSYIDGARTSHTQLSENENGSEFFFGNPAAAITTALQSKILTSPISIDGGAAAAATEAAAPAAQRTPRTETPSDPTSNNNALVFGSATTDSNDGEDDSDGKPMIATRAPPTLPENMSTTPKTKSSNSALSTTPYSPFPHHMRESAAASQTPAVADQSSGEQTLFHLSASSSTTTAGTSTTVADEQTPTKH
jgi:hypothetical protein